MKKLFSFLFVLIVVTWISNSVCGLQKPPYPLAFSSSVNSQIWEIHDTVTPTLDKIEWLEDGVHPKPPSWIFDGEWYEAHSRQILVKSGNYIFATFSESLNWSAVSASLETEGFYYETFDDFRSHLWNDQAWWLMYSWGLPSDWLGISPNTTSMAIDFDPSTSTAFIEMSCRITNIPEYFLQIASRPGEIGIGAEKLPKPLFAAFDLAAIYIGDFDALQLYEDYGTTNRHYRIYFKAPATLLSQSIDMYSLSLEVSPPYVGQVHNAYRFINISMPSDSEIRNTSPSNISTGVDNIAMFALGDSDRYPSSFEVTSGPPVQDLMEFLIENTVRWATEPEIWVALGTAIIGIYAGFHGKRIWSRQKTYYRLYRSMINLYDHYSSNLSKFSQETENLSKSITKYFIDGKINDDQFDKLLTRRDDLLERAKKLKKRD